MTTLNRDTTLRALAAETSDRLRAAGVLCPDGDGVGHALLSLHTALVRVQYTAAVIIALDLAHNYVPYSVMSDEGMPEATVAYCSTINEGFSREALHFWASALATEWSRAPFPHTEETGPVEQALIHFMLVTRLMRALWNATPDPVAAVRAYAPESVYLPVRAC